MSTDESRNLSRRNNAAKAIKAAVGILIVTALTYIAVVGAQHAPSLSGTSSFLTSQTPPSSPKPAGRIADATAPAQPAAAAAPSTASQRPSRDFDYFPDHYVNHATRIEERPPTF
jgi:hypothetical protein